VSGGAGNYTISTSTNQDGGPGNDLLTGTSGSDTRLGGAGDDVLIGSLGNDSLVGGDDADLLYGGSDSDTLDGGLGHDILNGDGGIDTADYSGRTANLAISLDGQGNDGTINGTNSEGDNVAYVVVIVGGSGNDFISASG